MPRPRKRQPCRREATDLPRPALRWVTRRLRQLWQEPSMPFRRTDWLSSCFLRSGGTQVECAIAAVRSEKDTPAPEGLQEAQLVGRQKSRAAMLLNDIPGSTKIRVRIIQQRNGGPGRTRTSNQTVMSGRL